MLKKFRIVVFIPLVLAATSLAAQGTVKPKSSTAATTASPKDTPAPKAAEADKSGSKEVTYLDLVHARDRALKLKENNMGDLQLVHSLRSALPEAVDNGTAQNLSNEYKEGVKLIYRREYVEAQRTLRTNRDNITTAMGKACEVLRQKTLEMLNQSADRMADLEMQADTAPEGGVVVMADTIEKGAHRLSVGYQQLTLATQAEKHRRYNEALSHYRLARLHAIYLQIDLAPNEQEKNAIRSKYQNEIDDKRTAPSAQPASKPAAEKTAEKTPPPK